MRHCGHPSPEPACDICRRYDADPGYRAFSDRTAAILSIGARVPLPLSPCIHETGAIATYCTSCEPAAAELRHVRDCELHGLVTRGPNSGGMAACASCSDYESQSRPTLTTRHLVYHIYPVAGNGAWQANVDALVKRLGLFNGSVTVAVAIDSPAGRQADPTGFGAPDPVRQIPRCDSLAAVKARFGRHAERIEFLEFANDPTQREVLTFEPLFSRLPVGDPTHATLYAQAKGVTRPPGHVAHRWTDALYETCLDYWPLVARQLKRFAVTGSFKKLGMGWPAEQSASQWHYSGSWFWFRNSELLARPDWKRIDPFWGGIESYPSLHFTAAESGCLFHERPNAQMNLYDAGEWDRVVTPALAAWRAENAALRTEAAPPASRLLNLGCGPFYAPGWINTDVIAGGDIRPDVVTPPGEPLPFPAGWFDRVYLGHVLEHVAWGELPALLAEVRRVCAPDGRVCVVGPDIWRSVDRLLSDPDRRGAVAFLAGVVEDDQHHQHDAGRDQLGARHQWNCYEARVVRLLRAAGFAGVRPVPLTSGDLAGWPVVDFSNPWQCAVIAEVAK